jgi:hypothetical protein
MLYLNRATGEPDRPPVAGVRTVTEHERACRPLGLGMPFRYLPWARAADHTPPLRNEEEGSELFDYLRRLKLELENSGEKQPPH